ncbi:hypothetical protein ACK3Y4_11120, partial [Aeromonas caviae]
MFGLEADRNKFKKDPLSYSAQGFLQWRMIESMVTNSDFDPYTPPTNEILKNPILWISQAEALTQAAVTIIKSEPKFENMPIHLAMSQLRVAWGAPAPHASNVAHSLPA